MSTYTTHSLLLIENIFNTSCTKISESAVSVLKESLMIRFTGEAGMVYIFTHHIRIHVMCVCVCVCVWLQGSGVKREWFDNLSREVLNPDYALFTQSADGEL